MKTKIFTGLQIVAVLTWKEEDKKVFVHWFYAFDQEPINANDIPDFLVRKVTRYCEENGLTLWSY